MINTVIDKKKLSPIKLNSIYKKNIEDNFGKKEQIKYWLELITVISISEANVLKVAVQNEFIKDFLLDKYPDDLLLIFKEIFQIQNLSYNIYIQEVVINEEKRDEVISQEEMPRVINRSKKKSRNWNVINTRYTFDNFIQGKNNQMAYTIAKNIADNYKVPTQFNPFIIYGPTGLGKSHLVQSIFINIKKDNKKFNVLYTTGELFLQEYMDFLKKKNSSKKNFEAKYRDVEILIIDDIQVFEKLENVQKKFRQIYKNLIEKDKKIILTLDRPLENLKFITTEFVEEVKQGAIIDITYPDFETRVAILEHKAKIIHKIDYIPDEIFYYIASSYENSNIRALEGALNKVIFSHKNLSMPLTLTNVKELVHPQKTDSDSKNINDNLSISKIVDVVSSYLNVPANDILGKSRKKEITTARHVSAYLVKEFTDLSNNIIGKFYNKDQASIAYSINFVSRKLSSNELYFVEIIEEISKKLI